MSGSAVGEQTPWHDRKSRLLCVLPGIYIQHWVRLIGNRNSCPSDLKIAERE